jgi:hypothetical protein
MSSSQGTSVDYLITLSPRSNRNEKRKRGQGKGRGRGKEEAPVILFFSLLQTDAADYD